MKQQWTKYQTEQFQKAVNGELGGGKNMLDHLMSIFPDGRYGRQSMYQLVSNVRTGKQKIPCREYDNSKVLRLSMGGYSNEYIAKECGISQRSVAVMVCRLRGEGHFIPYSKQRIKGNDELL